MTEYLFVVEMSL